MLLPAALLALNGVTVANSMILLTQTLANNLFFNYFRLLQRQMKKVGDFPHGKILCNKNNQIQLHGKKSESQADPEITFSPSGAALLANLL